MKEFLETIIKYIVDDHDMVKIEEVEGDSINVLKLQVAKNEIGKVIGRKGRTADALRRLLNAVSAKNNKRIVLEILD